jgi:hypothetical protein
MTEQFSYLPTYWPSTTPNSNWCGSCNAWVGPEHRHDQHISAYSTDPMSRIASALERIAAALERSDGR